MTTSCFWVCVCVHPRWYSIYIYHCENHRGLIPGQSPEEVQTCEYMNVMVCECAPLSLVLALGRCGCIVCIWVMCEGRACKSELSVPRSQEVSLVANKVCVSVCVRACAHMVLTWRLGNSDSGSVLSGCSSGGSQYRCVLSRVFTSHLWSPSRATTSSRVMANIRSLPWRHTHTHRVKCHQTSISTYAVQFQRSKYNRSLDEFVYLLQSNCVIWCQTKVS